MDLFRKKMRANPDGTLALLDDMNLAGRKLFLGGTAFKKIEFPDEIPERLKRWYASKEMYIGKYDPDRRLAFSDKVLKEVKKDFRVMAPLYQMLRGCADDISE